MSESFFNTNEQIKPKEIEIPKEFEELFKVKYESNNQIKYKGDAYEQFYGSVILIKNLLPDVQ
jgi:hypothetical protein